MKKVLSIIATGLVLWFVIGGSAMLLAHDTGYDAHSVAHEFHFNYNSQFNVYCGWRHAFEGISCVSTK